MTDSIVAKHLIEHYPYYSSWFDNCQAYAVNILATTLLCPFCGCGPSLQEVSRPSNAYFSLLSVSLLRRKLFATTIYASLFAYAIQALQSGRLFSWGSGRFLIACFIFYATIYNRHLLQSHTKESITNALGSQTSSAYHIFDHTPLMFASNELPFQDDCFRCRSIAKRKKFLTKKCRQMSAYKSPRGYTERASSSWSFWKSVLSGLTWSAPAGFLFALDWVFYLPPRIVLPVVCSVQLSVFYLVRGVHGTFYSAGYRGFVPAPWVYPVGISSLIYTLRILLYDLGFGFDPAIKVHTAFSQSLFGPQDSPVWRFMRMFSWILAIIIYLLVVGWVYYELQESKKHDEEKIGKLLGSPTAFGNPAMSWRRRLKRAPTV